MFGTRFTNDMYAMCCLQVDARVLGTEDLLYGNQKKINPGTTGAWNLRDTRHLSGCRLNSWAVVSLLSDPTGAPVRRLLPSCYKCSTSVF